MRRLQTFESFINEKKMVDKQPDMIFFRNPTQKMLWDKFITGQLSDGKWENSSRGNWRFFNSLKSGVDASNPRVTAKTSGNVVFNFAAKDLLDAIGDEMLEAGRNINPSYTMKMLTNDLKDMSDLVKTAGYYGGGSVEKAKKRMSIGFDPKDTKRIEDIVTKSKGDLDKEIMYAKNMAASIDDGAKALRRGEAAAALGKDVLAGIFFKRSRDLGFIDPGDQTENNPEDFFS